MSFTSSAPSVQQGSFTSQRTFHPKTPPSSKKLTQARKTTDMLVTGSSRATLSVLIQKRETRSFLIKFQFQQVTVGTRRTRTGSSQKAQCAVLQHNYKDARSIFSGITPP